MLFGTVFTECLEDQKLSSMEITGISADSRQVLPGYVFVAVRGKQGDGRDYINDAIKRGARAIVTDCEAVLRTYPFQFYVFLMFVIVLRWPLHVLWLSA